MVVGSTYKGREEQKEIKSRVREGVRKERKKRRKEEEERKEEETDEEEESKEMVQ